MAGTKAMLETYNLKRFWTNPVLVQGKGWKEWKRIVEERVEDREDVERRDRSLASVSETCSMRLIWVLVRSPRHLRGILHDGANHGPPQSAG
jgi:hypothetical protein